MIKQIPAKVSAALSSVTGNAQDVADAVLRIIETPAGEKQLRYLVSPESFGVDQINALSDQVQARVLETFGLAANTRFLKGSSRLHLATRIKRTHQTQRGAKQG